MKSKKGAEVAEKLREIFYDHGFLPSLISNDLGTEFCNSHIKALCKEIGATHVQNDPLVKGSNKSETANSRIVGLLRRELNSGHEWTKKYMKVIFSLNVTDQLYPGGLICTPSYMLNGRRLKGVPLGDDQENALLRSETKVREIMAKIAKHKIIDTPSLACHIDNRQRQYKSGERVLVWNENILGKKLLKTNGILKIKLQKFWEVATIVKRFGENYLIRQKNGVTRKVNRKQLKQYNSEETDVDETSESL